MKKKPQQKVGDNEVKELKEFEKCKKEREEYLTGWKRALADSANERKQFEKMGEQARLSGIIHCAKNVIQVIDSIEIALSHDSSDKTLHKGIVSIHKQFIDSLKLCGVSQFDPTGEMFDPTNHESVGSCPVEKKKDDGRIIEVMQKGYKIKETILRPAKVMIGSWEEKQ